MYDQDWNLMFNESQADAFIVLGEDKKDTSGFKQCIEMTDKAD